MFKPPSVALHISLIALFGSFLPVTATHAAAQATAALESLERIRETAERFAREQATQPDADTAVRVGQLDPRLRLPRCAASLDAYLAPGARSIGNTTVGVRCDGERPWSILVPVRISQQRDVVVLTRALNPGDTISRDALALSRRDTATLSNGYFGAIDEVEGSVTRRAFSAGTILNSRLVTPAKVVQRGEQVRIAASNPAIAVEAMGIALREGRLGERIQVRNINSARVIDATVIATGVVRVVGR